MGSHDKKTDKHSYVLPGSLFLLLGSVKFCGESPTGSVKKITKNRPEYFTLTYLTMNLKKKTHKKNII